MAEVSSSPNGEETVDMEAIRSRLNLLFKSVGEETFGDDDGNSSFESFLEDGIAELLSARSEIELEELNISSLNSEDSEMVLMQLKRKLSLVEDCQNTEDQIDDLTRVLHEDSAKLYGDLVALDMLFKSTNSKDVNKSQGYMLTGNDQSRTVNACDDDTFRIFQLDRQIEKADHCLNQLQDLYSVFMRNEALGQIMETLSEDVKLIGHEGNCIRLGIRTAIFSSDVSPLLQKLDCIVEPMVVYHELVIEVEGESMELKKIEIFPSDVCLDSIVNAAKFSRSYDLYPESRMKSPIEWIVRKVKQQIFMCNVRRIVVQDASKSRHSFEYSDKDETAIAHLVGGIDAFIKIPLGWPMSSSGLHLIAVKGLDTHSTDISLSSLFKIKERANSLDAPVRHHLLHFADAIEEILLQELHQKP